MSSSSSFPICTVVESALSSDETFTRTSYGTSVVLERLEKLSTIQRFQNTSNTDISVLFDAEATRSDQEDYLVGLLWSSFAILIFGLLWLMMLTFCKLWGPSRVGFCSARRLKPPRPDEPTEALEKKETIEEQQRRRDERRSGGVAFQHNGRASGYDDAPLSPSSTNRMASSIVKAPKKIVKGTIKAPKRVLSRARKQKRKIEQKFSKTKKFEKFQSGDDFPEYEDEDYAISGASSHHNDIRIRDTDRNDGDDDDDDDDEVSVMLLTQEDEREIADYEVAVLAYYKICEKRNTRMRRIRAMASICCACIIVAAVLFVVYGTRSLTNTTTIMIDGINRIEAATSKISDQVDDWIVLQDQTTQATAKFLDTTLFNDKFCPGNSGPFCSIESATPSSSATSNGVEDTTSTSVCDFTELQQQLGAGNVYDALWNYLDGTLDLVAGEGISELQSDLQQWNEYMASARKNLQTFNWSFWVASGCNLALATICLSLLVAVLMLYFGRPLPRCFKFVRSWLFLPSLLLLTTIGWIFTAIFIAMSLANLDMCINTPDKVVSTILRSLEMNGNLVGNILPDFLAFFVNGCSSSAGTSLPRELDQKIVIVQQLVLPAMQNVQKTIAQTGTSLQTYCGATVDMDPFRQLIDALATQLCTLVESLSLIRNEFTCSQFYPLYEEVAYEGLCYEGTDGFVWAASTQLAMVVLVMVLLTLRVAYYELDEVGESSGSCCRDWCCLTTSPPRSVEDDDEDDDEILVEGDGYIESDNRKAATSGITEAGSLDDAQ
eukprot:CAMPEP_0113462176 /NCGR_PEP_ID=MMETSP0014_2-20120614/11941_1 /TAXON_ID=2857 /ORGANISM="Nitzschia sp." /LENGTH=775 /DNA_ID=CAMNT_0000353999 /DNA_START=165 /DNA_END=2492 /DNA_ORIENTATION=+ /assembly_acc=CAM_ASM_000159